MPLHSEAMSVLGPTTRSIVLSAWSRPVVLTVRMTRSAGVASLARTDVEIAGLAVDGERVVRMTLKTGIIHDVFDGVVAERPGDHAAVEQADAALADKGDLVDLHVNHLPM